MDRFKEIFSHILKWEGGDKLHNVSGDTGGWTKYGIAYNFNKDHFSSLDEFKAMGFDTAAEITHQNYYKPLYIDLVQKESQAMFFDMAFNMGVKTAVKLAQRALGITDDGVIGNVTKSKLAFLCKKRLYDERVKYYHSIVANKPIQKKFLKGWLNRSNYYLDTDI